MSAPGRAAERLAQPTDLLATRRIRGAAEKRKKQAAVGEIAKCRYTDEAVGGNASTATHNIRLNLIIPMVLGNQVQTGVIPAPDAQESIAREARRFMNPGSRLFSRPH